MRQGCRFLDLFDKYLQNYTDTLGKPIIKPVDDWKVTIDGENVALPDTGDSSTVQTNQTEVDPDNFDSMALLLIHGGCDSEGEFFNDVFVATIP